jgi:hypothetical protein
VCTSSGTPQQDPPFCCQGPQMLGIVRDRHPVLLPDGAEAGSSAAISSRISTVAGTSTARNPAESPMRNCARRSRREDRALDAASRRGDVEPLGVPAEPVRAQVRAPIAADAGDDDITPLSQERADLLG